MIVISKIKDVDVNKVAELSYMVGKMHDEEMLEALCEAIDNHYRHDVSYTVDGLTLSFTW